MTELDDSINVTRKEVWRKVMLCACDLTNKSATTSVNRRREIAI